MKIAHVVSTFPPHIGGMGMVTYEEAERLQGRGHEVTVFTLRYPQTSYSSNTAFSFRVVRLKPVLRLGDGGVVPQLFSALKEFDLIHLHYPFYGGAEWVYRAARWYKKPYVVTYHMDARPEGFLKTGLQKIYDAWWAWRVLSGAKAVIGVDRTHFLNTVFGKKLLSYRKCVEIKLGVDAEIFKPEVTPPNPLRFADATLSSMIEPPSPAGSDLQNSLSFGPLRRSFSEASKASLLIRGGDNEIGNTKVILFVGNLMPLKRLDVLLEAFKEVRFSEPEVVLVVVGEGVARRHYEHLATELGIGDNVFFRGSEIDKQKLAAYYAQAAVTVVPSDQESFSLVTSEAMAARSVVVVSDIPILKDRIHDREDGFLFRAGDSEDLARVIVEVLHLSFEERERITTKARARVVKEFNWDRHVDELEKIYRSVV